MDGVQTLHVDFRIGDWLVQPAQCRLTSNGRAVHVRPKVMDLLTCLARHQGEVLSKDALLDEVWGSQAISESALTRTVTELRQALGDNAEEPRILETIPKRGYRLIAPVTVPAMTMPAETTAGLKIPWRVPAAARARRGLPFVHGCGFGGARTDRRPAVAAAICCP